VYKLTVIAGPSAAQPARGSSFAVGNGTFSIGRHSENQIVLHSGNVSKKHCVLVVDNTRVAVEDQGSANGTFVNGKLSAKREVRPGDRISVGEFVLELGEGGIQSLPAPYAPPRGGVPVGAHYGANVVPFPGTAPAAGSSPAPDDESAPMPKDLLGKAKYFFDRFILPYFLGFNERYEWRIVIGSLFALYLVLNLVVSLSPLMDEQKRAIEAEIKVRAKTMAHEVAERNAPYMAAKAESKMDLGTFARADGVRVAAIVDLENRILAPSSKAGQYFESGSEASAAVKARKLFVEGRETGITVKSDDETIVAIEPVRILNAAKGKNETAALAIVSIDTTLANAEAGEIWMVYAHTLVLSIAIGLFIFYLMYRITLRPFQEMNRKIDQSLRGEGVEFKPTVYFTEIDPLWTVIDSALKRVARDHAAGGSGGGGAPAFTAQDLLGPLRAMASHAKSGVAVLDEERKVLYMNGIFEEITRIRLDAAEGQPLASVSDQAFGALVGDLCERASPGSDGVEEEFDFSGTSYQVHVATFGSFGDPKCYVFTLARKEG
jgi:PAS domain-containing protein